ncbi:hypothetical protein FRB95_005827 [Tulasnella sp. JGI-2019a]|nr:hypothetical protein FRB93_006432 [Tulasnella sp. JGI-2019a]KAG9029007.1 hypothetical protein FRB95_005827 [Tulasnella sp. JGI-2019a]
MTSKFSGPRSTRTSLEVESPPYESEKDEKAVQDSSNDTKPESSPREKDRRLSEGTNEGRTPTLVGETENDLPRAPTIDIDLEAKPPNNKVTEDHVVDDAFPEGGRGWLVVFGACLLTASTFGLVNSWGVFQASYQTSILSHVDPSTLAWIGSVQYSMVFLPGLISGRLFDLGWFHPILIGASALLVISTLLVAQCKEYWQFMLAQGLATGIASGLVFGGALPVVGHWFHKKRATAYGVVAVGSSYGGTVFPIIIRKLIPAVGLPWTLRILAFILLGHLALANMLVRRRLPPVYVAGGLFNLRAFKSAPYSLYVAASTVAFLGLYTCLTFIDNSGIEAGLSPDFSFYLVSIANAGSGVGRIVSGILSDRFGSLNILIPFTIFAAIFTFIWPHCTTEGSLVAIAVLYGVSSGAFVGLLAAPIAKMGDTSDIGRRTGMLFTVLSVGAVVGPPISGAIYTSSGGYNDVGIYAGITILVSAALMFAARWSALGGFRGRF